MTIQNSIPPKAIVGMIHTGALPGTPSYKNNWNEIIDVACQEASVYAKNGIDALCIENMHDTPYLNRSAGPEIVSCMAAIACEIKKISNLPCGIQILAGANKQALAVAKAAHLQFVRCEGFVFGHIADEGLMNSDAGELLRFRKMIDAEHIALICDIKKKHSAHALTADVDIVETAKAAEFFKADGVIITGIATGQPANPDETDKVKNNVSIPVWIGSGITFENLETYFSRADAFIVGSWFKQNGLWSNSLDPERVKKFVKKIETLRTY